MLPARPRPSARRRLLILTLCLPLAGCGADPGPPAARSPWPAGTVLTVAGRPVDAAQLDPLAAALADLEPAAALTHRRRLALLNRTVPLECGRALAGEARRRFALAEAESFARAARDEDPLKRIQDGDLRLERIEQDFLGLGVPLWFGVRELEPGSWSEPVEVPGAFVVAKLVARHDALRGVERRFVLLAARFPYLDDPARIDHEAARARVEAVDPEWEPVVPGLLRHRDGLWIRALEGS